MKAKKWNVKRRKGHIAVYLATHQIQPRMRVFKYLSPDRIDVVKNQAIRFTQAEYLNDRFEFKPDISQLISSDKFESLVDHYADIGSDNDDFQEIMKSTFDEIISQIPNPEFISILNNLKKENIDLWAQMIKSVLLALKPLFTQQLDSSANSERFVKELSKTIGVLSLTERFDNQLMWAYYADSHKGFVVEFDPNDDFFINPRSAMVLLKKLQKVRYSIERPLLRFFDYFNITESDMDYICISIFLTKSKAWKFEQEVRFMKTLETSSTNLKFNDENIHLFDFNSSIVKSIYIGHRASLEFENNIYNILNEPRYSHVELYKETLEGKGYEINFKQIR